MVQLVDECVLPADHVTMGPPPLPERMIRLGHETRAEALRALRVLQLVQPLELERQRSLRSADLPAERVLPSGGEARRADRADGAVREVGHGVERVVDLAPA